MGRGKVEVAVIKVSIETLMGVEKDGPSGRDP